MFESGNFKRRKRMRRHSYKPCLYKGELNSIAIMASKAIDFRSIRNGFEP